jgi:hypothetical protein
MNNHNLRLISIFNVVTLIFSLVMNFLAISIPLNGNSTRELSDRYSNLFVPAPFTFSIWSVIYLALIAHILLSIYHYYRDDLHGGDVLHKTGYWLMISNLCNGLWIVAWHYEALWLSVIIMLVLAYSLKQIYLSMQSLRPMAFGRYFWVLVPFSIYLGWISVATIANISAWLISISWGGLGITPTIWTYIVIGVATLLGILMAMRRQDVFYGAVIVWAFYGIFERHSAKGPGLSSDIAYAARAGMTLLLIYLVLMVIGKKVFLWDHQK